MNGFHKNWLLKPQKVRTSYASLVDVTRGSLTHRKNLGRLLYDRQEELGKGPGRTKTHVYNCNGHDGAHDRPTISAQRLNLTACNDLESG